MSTFNSYWDLLWVILRVQAAKGSRLSVGRSNNWLDVYCRVQSLTRWQNHIKTFQEKFRMCWHVSRVQTIFWILHKRVCTETQRKEMFCLQTMVVYAHSGVWLLYYGLGFGYLPPCNIFFISFYRINTIFRWVILLASDRLERNSIERNTWCHLYRVMNGAFETQNAYVRIYSLIVIRFT